MKQGSLEFLLEWKIELSNISKKNEEGKIKFFKIEFFSNRVKFIKKERSEWYEKSNFKFICIVKFINFYAGKI